MNKENRNRKILPASVLRHMPWRRLFFVGILFLCSVVVAGASLFGIAKPFGLALIAAGSGWGMTVAATLGNILGSLGQGEILSVTVASLLLCGGRIFLGALVSREEGDANPQKGKTSRRIRDPTGDAVPLPLPLSDVLRRHSATEHIPLRMALGGAGAMVSGTIRMLLSGTYTVRELLSVFFLAITVPLATLGFCTLTERVYRISSARDVGILLLLFAITRSLRDVEGIPFQAGVMFAFAAILVAARGFSPAARLRSDPRRITYAAVCGLVCGLALDPGGAPAYACAAPVAAVLFPLSAGGAVCGAWITAIAIAFAGGGLSAFAAVMPEMTVTAAALIPLFHFRILPDRLPLPRPAIHPAGTRAEAVEAAVIAGEKAEFGMGRIRALSDAMHKLSGVFTAMADRMRRPALPELKDLCDAAMEKRCEGCEKYSLCWEREYAATTDTVCRMAKELHQAGRVSAGVIPPHLASRCHHMSDILDEVNEGCAKSVRVAATADKSDIFADDFEAFSTLLSHTVRDTEAEFAENGDLSRKLQRSLKNSDFHAGKITVYGSRRQRIMARDLDLNRMRMGSEDIRLACQRMTGAHYAPPEYRLDGECVSMVMVSDPLLQLESGSATRAAGDFGQSGRIPPNGDCVLRFETEDGRYYMMICDGMGTGGEASVTSQVSAAFLEEVLRAGADMKVALTMLNNYMRSRSLECSAGIDLMEIDRYTGEARFVKSGAAPSFVIREGRLFRLCSKTVPIGILRALDAEMIQFTLERGDTIVMLSDGVAENFEDAAWLCDMLCTKSLTEAPPEEIADRIIRAATAGADPKHRDDVTAAVTKIRTA